MTIKEFLRDIKRKNTSIEILNEQLEKLRSIAEYKSPVIDDIGGGFGSPNVHSKEDLMCKVAEISEKLTMLKIEYLNDIDKTTDMIMSLKDEKTLNVFSKRYLEFKTWERIADEMDITFQWVHELHKRGLIELGNKYKNFFS